MASSTPVMLWRLHIAWPYRTPYPHEEVAAALGRLEALRRDYRSPRVALHSAKFFLDGVLENRTAAMLADYSGAPDGNAAIMFDLDQLHELFVAFDTARAACAWWSETGSISPGKFADLIVLDRDVLAIETYQISGTEVLLTLLGGREVHRAAGFAG
jgi:predicted amidohydrolase YtcJ